MGSSHSWIAVRGLEAKRALEALELEVARELRPGDFPRKFGMGLLPGGWLLVVCDDVESAFKGRLSKIATLGPAVACAVEEHVMYSEARGFEGGAETWRVARDPERMPDDVEVSGAPPGALQAILREAKAQQDGDEDDVDFLFDVPGQVARSLCGFQLGEDEPEGFRFSELRKAGTPGKGSGGFFARLFGRG